MSERKLVLDEYSRSSKFRILSKCQSSSDESDEDSYTSESCSSSSDTDSTNRSSSSSSTESDEFFDSKQRRTNLGRRSNLKDRESESDFSSPTHSDERLDERGNEDCVIDSCQEDNSDANAIQGGLEECQNQREQVIEWDSLSENESTSGQDSSTDEESGESEDESDEEDEDDDLPMNSNDPIYPGAPISIGESVLMIFTLAMRFRITGVLLSSILSLIALHCIQPNRCVKTIYKLKKFFANLKVPLIRHYYCCDCFSKLDKPLCQKCNSDNTSYFLEISILAQLASFYKRADFRDNLNYRNTREKKNDYEDIYDGSIYKSLPKDFIENNNNITFTWNSDGVPLFKSSKISIWPFYLMVNELPYKLRIKKENLILAGLWFGPNKPLANLFMNTFKKDLRKLYKGVDFVVPGILNPLRVRGLVVSGTCDLCAKAVLLNIQQFNATYGCPHCKIETVRIDNVQIYPFIESEQMQLRTTEESKVYAQEAQDTKIPVFGVKGPTALSLLVPDYVNSTTIDVMHCVFQGITKKLMSFWFDAEHRTHESSLFAFINIVNDKIKGLTLPSFVPRIPRKVTDYSYWKASELKSFLLVYSLMILKNVMAKKFFDHHLLLVHGITLLTLSSISEPMVVEAKRVLTEYVRRFETLYGPKHQTCNLHLLLHLPDVVKKLGPLWSTSCFPFESMNGVLKTYVHGSRYAELQIYSSVATFLCLSELKQKILRPETQAFEFCKKIEKSGICRYKTKHLCEDIFAVGAYTKVDDIPEFMKNALRNHLNVFERSQYHVFKRLLKDNIYYENEAYALPKKTNSSCIKFASDDINKIGIINYFVTVCKCDCEVTCNQCNENCKTYAIVTKCIVEPAFMCPVTNQYIPTISLCEKLERDVISIDVRDIINVCYYTKVDEQLYVVHPTNLHEIE